MRDGNGLQYFLTDHLGSVLAVTDASGTLISEQRYLPFGEVRTDVGEITQTDFGYTGQRGLPGTGLMDYRYRFLSTSLARFINPDSIIPNPANPQALNRYTYVNNSPINYNDPTGHKPCWAGKYSCNLTGENISSLRNGSDADRAFLENLYGGVLPEVMLFCGDPGDINTANINCPGQMPAWEDNPNGFLMHYQYYTGSKAGTALAAENNFNIPNNVPLILICYSAGTEACLMYANNRISNGGKVQATVLLGPTFSGKNENGTNLDFNSPNGGWAAYMDNILKSGGDMVIVDDKDGAKWKYIGGKWWGNEHTDAWSYRPPGNASGNYSYVVSATQHYTSHPNWISGTNTNESLRNFIYGLIDALAIQ